MRKRLERKSMDIEDATAALRVLPTTASKGTILALISNLQVRHRLHKYASVPASSMQAF